MLGGVLDVGAATEAADLVASGCARADPPLALLVQQGAQPRLDARSTITTTGERRDMRIAKLLILALTLGACTAEVDGVGAPLDEVPYVSERIDGEEVLGVVSVDHEHVARTVLRSGSTHLDVFVEAREGWELLDVTLVLGHARLTLELDGMPTFDPEDGVSFAHVPVPLHKVGLAPGDGFKVAVEVTAREQASDYATTALAIGAYRLRDEVGLDA